jgi:hypothetical protein
MCCQDCKVESVVVKIVTREAGKQREGEGEKVGGWGEDFKLRMEPKN